MNCFLVTIISRNPGPTHSDDEIFCLKFNFRESKGSLLTSKALLLVGAIDLKEWDGMSTNQSTKQEAFR